DRARSGTRPGGRADSQTDRESGSTVGDGPRPSPPRGARRPHAVPAVVTSWPDVSPPSISSSAGSPLSALQATTPFSPRPAPPRRPVQPSRPAQPSPSSDAVRDSL